MCWRQSADLQKFPQVWCFFKVMMGCFFSVFLCTPAASPWGRKCPIQDVSKEKLSQNSETTAVSQNKSLGCLKMVVCLQRTLLDWKNKCCCLDLYDLELLQLVWLKGINTMCPNSEHPKWPEYQCVSSSLMAWPITRWQCQNSLGSHYERVD